MLSAYSNYTINFHMQKAYILLNSSTDFLCRIIHAIGKMRRKLLFKEIGGIIPAHYLSYTDCIITFSFFVIL